jgi:hypothetical protein
MMGKLLHWSLAGFVYVVFPLALLLSRDPNGFFFYWTGVGVSSFLSAWKDMKKSGLILDA